MRVVKLDIPIYQGYLRIVITKDFVKAAKKLNIDDEGNDLNLFGAFVTLSRDKRGIPIYNVFFHKNVGHNLLAHEVCHLVNFIFSDRKIKLDILNDEPQAYLTGWVTAEIYKALKK